MKRLLFLGGSPLQLPGIIRAKEMGLSVAIADMDRNAVGISYADSFYEVSTIDKERVLQAAIDFRADGVFTFATDYPMRSVAYACEKLGLPGIPYETAVCATDKGQMALRFKKAGVKQPWFHILHSGESLETLSPQLCFPCVCKPTDNSGNRGVQLVNAPEELVQAVKNSRINSRSGDVIIQEYMTGPEVSVEIIVWDSIIHTIAITDKLTTGEPFFIEMGHSEPTRVPPVMADSIRELAEQAVRALGIHNGAAHAEIKITNDGPKMVEIGARLGGGCINTHLVPLSTGVDILGAAIQCTLGQEPKLTKTLSQAAALRHLPVKEGTIHSIDGVEQAKEIPGVDDVVFLKKVGDKIQKFANGADRIGMVIAHANTVDEAVEICETAKKRIRINYC